MVGRKVPEGDLSAELSEMTLGLRNFSFALSQFMLDPEAFDRQDMTGMMFTLKSRAETLAEQLDAAAFQCRGLAAPSGTAARSGAAGA
ncbi:hypothetical protein [Mangrovicoccus sp. HB161399]|uniref:hypothetical protein n=1 Tax=Mangrovicoccus sp. HB161399 TaxID=2720392 RepID=UPI001554ADAE|nr:hypothetical protein [Mangrovicoccus sp. HB161399]